MNKLCFVYSWKNETNQSWSGTPKGIEAGLNKQTTLRTANVYAAPVDDRLAKIKQVLLPTAAYKHAKTILNADCKQHQGPYLVFGEYSSDAVSRTYCYQDLSIDFMLRELKNTESHYASVSKITHFFKAYAYKRKAKKAAEFYKNCAGVFTMSEWLKKDLIENTGLPAEKVHHVGGGCTVDVSRVDWSKKTGNKFFFVGKDWAKKNGELVVEAFKQLAQRHPECDPQLYIAGPVAPPPSVVGDERIHFVGRLSYEELVGYYNLCDYFVMPSAFDAYGLVFIEALSFGLPCIANNRFAMPEFIQHGENGYLLNRQDADELSGWMEHLLLDGDAITQNVRRDHKAIAEKYSWDSVATRILDVLKQEGHDIERRI